ncbi:MAG: hypothetical protein RBS05_08400 [Zoogloea oleivorans]|jgi:hypothetical protein|uniref:Uncharacterized protein n=1 Tax=Zoogloea oleivorans TaxID=1552750 RepID=A0A6C2CL83_9RHOO|nr:hypothetical protein [Zoogloea oleivorans]MBT9498024.1 hypothetical protein [Zoogloea sp.]MDY0035912.1 hypothetical protein [Zoogloea oleivorans]TYC54791.1 hypothetical protein ETQ85_16635 [Zoogloea oleivorans]
MSITPNPEMEVSLDDEEAEHLIARTDALIHRHESFAAPSETDDLPVLTDVVDERIEPYIGETSPIILEPVTPAAELPETRAEPIFTLLPGTVDQAERLVALDTAISRHIEEWVANELPQLVSRELDDLAERLRDAAAAHLRATLLPLVSAEIADQLDSPPDA